MTNGFERTFGSAIMLFQRLSVAIIVMLALGMVGLCAAAAFGLIPWLGLSLSFGDTPLPDGGMYLQLFFTGFCVVLAFYLPAHMRMMRLENSHRNFHVSMNDVTRAYRAAHEADRAQLFKTGSEFDEVRDRMAHLRAHPDLAALEPDILELAAQMSVEARDLARVYSDEKVERARSFLRQRQQEMEMFEDKLALARHSVDELKNWVLQLDTEEKIATEQMRALEADLRDLLPYLGYEIEADAPAETTVVPMSKPAEDKDADDERERALRIARNLTQMRAKTGEAGEQPARGKTHRNTTQTAAAKARQRTGAAQKT